MKNIQKKPSGIYEARIRIHPWEKVTYKSLGTKDKVVAEKKLNDLYRQMERESEGIGTTQKIKSAAESSLSDLIQKYLGTLEAGERYINQTGSRLKRICSDCDWKRLKDIDPISFQQWRAEHSEYTPKTKNHYLSSIHSFLVWLIDNGLAEQNPLEKIKPVKVRGKHAFKYRALNMEELSNLLALSKRSEIYHFAALTGLRHKEVGLVQWGDLRFDTDIPFLVVRVSTTKCDPEDSTIKLHSDLVHLLKSIRPTMAKPADVVFPCMPDNKTVRRDFKKVGIETKNDRNEKASFHSFRKTFCTMLHMAGVPQRETQELMRHSEASLTNDVYADRSLFALGNAIDSLPSLIAPSTPSIAPSKSGFEGQNVAFSGVMAETVEPSKKPKNLEKQKESSGFEEFLLYKKWCTRMESNHHAIAGTRT